MTMKTVDIGRLGERQAARFLRKQGLKILEQNIHVSHNEIDIIAKDKRNRAVVFVEVKTRSVDNDLYSPFGTPASAVTKQKQKRTIDAARGYILSRKGLGKLDVRFDVVEVYLSKESLEVIKINHIENAFCV